MEKSAADKRRPNADHPGEERLPAVITVFFTLAAAVFLALFFALVESVRVQGARAQAAINTDLGNYSLFSEYEKQLLTDYELFAIDGGAGSGSFRIGEINERLRSFIHWNESPAEDGIAGLCFDPWHIHLTDSSISEYELLTDRGGCGFYQQAVSFMKETAVTGIAGKLHDYYADARKASELREEYEQAQAGSDADLENAQSTAAQILEEAKKNKIRLERPKGIINPLKTLAGVLRKGIYENVIGDRQVSDEAVSGFALASHRLLKRGSLSVKKKHGGLTDDLYFREYLLDHFPNLLEGTGGTDQAETGGAVSGSGGNPLSCQAEYLIAGKKSDRQNIRKIATELVLLREGFNYLYCIQDEQMSAAAEGLALLLMGWTGMMPLVTAMQQALLLGWSYAESLVDVRTLFDGGRVPLTKSPDTWYLSLDQLALLPAILEEGGKDRGSGLFYRDYLRILMNMQSVSQQEKRALDLIELNLRNGGGLSGFRVDHCIVAVRDETSWTIPPLFFRITGAYSGIGASAWETNVKAGFAYQ